MIDSALNQLSTYIENLYKQQAKPFYLLVSDNFRCLRWSGHAENFGFNALKQGDDLTEKLLFLVGMEASDIPVLTLPYLSLGECGITAQVHAIRLKSGWGIALIDTTEDKNSRHHYQQMAHELKLAQDKQKHLLKDLEKAQQLLEQQNTELEEKSQLKTQFIARMSHEFRTPLSSIIGFSELARDDLANPAKIQIDLNAIDRGAKYLLNLVDNLLDQAVITHNDIIIRPTSCDLSALNDELDQLFQPMAQQRDLYLSWWLDSSLPPRVWLDEIRLRQVLINIIGNAFKFTESGGITASFEWENDQLLITIQDTGSGIPVDKIPAMFEAFNQGQESLSSKRGAGLGLSISNEIVRRLGGAIKIKPHDKQGTIVQITLDAPARNQSNITTQSLQNSTILFIEPDQDNRQLFEIYLGSAGCNVLTANSSRECIQHCIKQMPDIVLMSLHEKIPNNLPYIQAIRETNYNHAIIGITSRDDENTYNQAINAGFTHVMTKPIKRSDFLQFLAEQLPNT